MIKVKQILTIVNKMEQKGKINPDLIKERKLCTFNTLELTHLLDGGNQKTADRKWRGTTECKTIYFLFFNSFNML